MNLELLTLNRYIIAGPCGAETREQTLATYDALAGLGIDMFRAGVWKPRTRPNQWEGAGNEALEWLAEGKRRSGIPFGVEVGSVAHVAAAINGGADMVWLGARTVSNPFSVQEIAEALKESEVEVYVKNPLSADVELWSGAVERILAAGIERVGLIHRGFSLGGGTEYRYPPVWHVAIEMHRRYPMLKMLCDPSHIAGSVAGVGEIAQRAAAMHYDGLFIESHVEPQSALSDARQQLSPDELRELLAHLNWRKEMSANPDFVAALERLRAEIDALDAELLSVLARRMEVSGRVGEIKRANDVAILQPARWNALLEGLIGRAKSLNLPPDFIRSLFELIHEESIKRQ